MAERMCERIKISNFSSRDLTVKKSKNLVKSVIVGLRNWLCPAGSERHLLGLGESDIIKASMLISDSSQFITLTVTNTA